MHIQVFCGKFARLLLYINFFPPRVNKNVDEKNPGPDRVHLLFVHAHVFEGSMVIKLDCGTITAKFLLQVPLSGKYCVDKDTVRSL